jgi:hypothetical protein
LGIPPDLLKASQAQSRGFSFRENNPLDMKASETFSPFVAFYATQTYETTPELLFSNQTKQKAYSIFTYTLTKVLKNQKYRNITYRQAAQLILNHYAADYLDRFTTTTPLVEGNLDAIVFNDVQGKTLQQWKIVEQKEGTHKIDVGKIHQLAEGSIFAVVPNPTSDKIMGYVKITRADIFDSQIKPIKYDNKQVLRRIPRKAYARLVVPKFNFNFGLRVARPPVGINTQETRHARQALTDLADKPEEGIKITWVDANDTSAYLRLLLDSESQKLWLLSTGGEVIKTGNNQTFSIGLDNSNKALRKKLMTRLQSIAKYVLHL